MEKGVEKAKKRRKGSGEEQYKETIEGEPKLSTVAKRAYTIHHTPRDSLELYLLKGRVPGVGPVHDHLVDPLDGADLVLLNGRRVTQVGSQVRALVGAVHNEEELLVGRVCRFRLSRMRVLGLDHVRDLGLACDADVKE